MGKVNALLNQRLNKTNKSNKMTALAKESAEGSRTGFAGIFGAVQLSDSEKELLEELLLQHSLEEKSIESDLSTLIAISAEIKAINNQAALLHGERIKKAQEVLKDYGEGAFTSWLLATYGNRQTPYNFLQYFDFYHAMPKTLRPRIEMMPRQAIYTLASREGALKEKQEIVEEYDGETKSELLEIIRETFPLDERDKRKENRGEKMVIELQRICSSIAKYRSSYTKRQKKIILDLVETIEDLL